MRLQTPPPYNKRSMTANSLELVADCRDSASVKPEQHSPGPARSGQSFPGVQASTGMAAAAERARELLAQRRVKAKASAPAQAATASSLPIAAGAAANAKPLLPPPPPAKACQPGAPAAVPKNMPCMHPPAKMSVPAVPPTAVLAIVPCGNPASPKQAEGAPASALTALALPAGCPAACKTMAVAMPKSVLKPPTVVLPTALKAPAASEPKVGQAVPPTAPEAPSASVPKVGQASPPTAPKAPSAVPSSDSTEANASERAVLKKDLTKDLGRLQVTGNEVPRSVQSMWFSGFLVGFF